MGRFIAILPIPQYIGEELEYLVPSTTTVLGINPTKPELYYADPGNGDRSAKLHVLALAPGGVIADEVAESYDFLGVCRFDPGGPVPGQWVLLIFTKIS